MLPPIECLVEICQPVPQCLVEIYSPTQLYIVLAITVATLSWLVKPSEIEQLEVRASVVIGTLVLLQIAHVLFYPRLDVLTNIIAHGGAWAGYVILATMLFSRAWTRSKSRPPELPLDDDPSDVLKRT